MARFKPPGQCPACGEWVPKGMAACDDCGACEKSGWKNPDEAQTYDGLDLPDDEFDYNEFIEREFGGRDGAVSGNKRSLWFWVGIVLVIILALGFLLPVLSGP